MRILFCAYDKPGHFASGPNAWIQRLIPVLSSKFKLEIETLFLYEENLLECPTIDFFKKHQLPFHLISKTTTPYVEDQIKLILRLLKNGKFNILIANLVIPALYCVRFLKSSEIPVIGVIHSADKFYGSVLRQFVDTPRSNSLSAVVTVSEFLKSKALLHNPNDITVETISCGTSTIVNTQGKEMKDPLRIIYAGRLIEEQKQISKLTQAFISASKSVKNTKYYIYGSGPDSDKVEELIKTSNTTNVFYSGSVPPSEIQDKMSENQVFTLLSDYEGMPVALMEAMSLGLVPVCLSEESGVNEIIKDGVNGFIVKNRKDEFQKRIKFLKNHPDDYSKMSHEAIKTIKDRYSIEVTAEKWYNLLSNMEFNPEANVYIPIKIDLPGETLFYGDRRKPLLKNLIKNKIERIWWQLRLALRPRARLKNFFKIDSSKN